MSSERTFERIFLVVLDGCGAGELPDAAAFGDAGANTLGNLSRMHPLSLPNLQALGLGNVTEIVGVPPTDAPGAFFGRMAEKSAGKDTTSGHWEMMGVVRTVASKTFPHGFPPGLIEPFCERIGRGILGNKTASGTEIIKELGAEHVATRKPIVYTSADSVFQVASHVDVIPLAGLYRICEIAREMTVGEYLVDRVIARPFTGEAPNFWRTDDRRDYSIEPPRNYLDDLVAAGVSVKGIGKIEDIFAKRGLTASVHTHKNPEGMDELIRAAKSAEFTRGLAFANLVDFDMLFGHRNDIAGYVRALEEFDAFLPGFFASLTASDLVIITSDHGNDPTTPSTDHSREHVPLLVYSPVFGSYFGDAAHRNLGVRQTFADVGATVAADFGIKPNLAGASFLSELAD